MANTIDQLVCSSCKLCMEVCPCKVIGINDKEELRFIQERESICLHCGQCMAICSTKAISVNGLSYEKDVFDLPANRLDYDNFISFLANRRSIRNFRNKPVPDDMLQKILDSISYAPNGAEPEKVNITVISSRRIIETALPHISKFLDDIVKWIDNPVSSFLIKSRKGPETFNTIKNHLYPMSKLHNYKLEYGDRITRGAPALMLFHAELGAEEHTNNSMIYATYAILSAHVLGLGAAMNGIVTAAINKVPEVRRVFQIPEGDEASMAVIVGYPKYRYKRAIQRKAQKIEWIN